jgi:hypothetical protein
VLVAHVADYAIFATDAKGYVRQWNSSARRLEGWHAAEILGAHVSRFYTPEDAAAGVPERLIAAATATGRAEREGWRVRKDGSRYWARVVVTAQYDDAGTVVGFAAVTHDLSDRRASEAQLAELRATRQQLEDQAAELEYQVTEARELAAENAQLLADAREAAARLSLLDVAVRATSEGVVITTAELDGVGPRIVHWNPAFVRVIGRPSDPMVGVPIRHVLGVDPSSTHAVRSRERILAGQPTDGRLTIARPDGETRIVDYRTAPVGGAHDGSRYLVIVLSDVTERVRLDEQFRQSQKMEALGQLAGGIAHDFNNLLTVIGASVSFLAQGIPTDDPRREDVEEIRAAAERAGSLTRQLLAFSRHQPFAPREIDLNDVVRSAEKLLRRVLGEPIELVTRVAPDLPTIVADRGQLEQVLLNLAVNARDAMPEGGRLEIETAPADDGGATLTVCDTGVGMSAAVQSRIFDPFFTTKEMGKGTGLGLSTVYGIVGRVGGTIAVESAPGGGARFTIRFPRAVAAHAAHTAHADSRPAAPEGTGRGELVLLVEDEAALRRLAARALVDAGYHVIEAPDGVAALETAAGLSRVDLLATDVIMPKMRGSVLASRMRARFPALRVLYMSGYTGDAEVEREREEPNTGFLEKPYDGVALSRAVRALLDA